MKDKRLSAYLSELYRWNKKINLTSVNEKDAVKILVEPSLGMAEFMPEKGRVVDIGSGGGIPGIILSLRFPECEFLLVDSDGKKSAFLAHVAGMLKLTNGRAVRERSEKLAVMAGFSGTADVVVSRAVKREDVFASAVGLLKPGGLVILHHSSKPLEPDTRFEPVGNNEFADCWRMVDSPPA
jgi:16S rRNA (guanine527-N7)-methyltransferase